MQVLVYEDHLVFVTDQGYEEVASVQQLDRPERSHPILASTKSLPLSPANRLV